MKVNLVVSDLGLIPATDDDKEQLKTLKRGTICECVIKEYRNYKFLRKYFSLINCAWEYLNDEQYFPATPPYITLYYSSRTLN